MNFIEFNNRFPTEEAVVAYYIKTALGGKVICPKCGCAERISVEKGRIKVFHCNNCNSSFSIFKNTIFEKSDTDLRKWLYAINLVTVSKKGISALQLKREIGVTYKTAWRMLKQIRIAMGNVSHDKIFETLVEIDETYVGGKPRKEAKSNKDDDDDTTPPSPNKRGVYGIYHHISVKYMQKYVDEFCFRMNNSDEDCFDNLVKLTAFP